MVKDNAESDSSPSFTLKESTPGGEPDSGIRVGRKDDSVHDEKKSDDRTKAGCRKPELACVLPGELRAHQTSIVRAEPALV